MGGGGVFLSVYSSTKLEEDSGKVKTPSQLHHGGEKVRNETGSKWYLRKKATPTNEA